MIKTKKRIEALSELFLSEQAYVADLTLWEREFRREIVELPFLSLKVKYEICDLIFINIHDIKLLHQDILNDMREANLVIKKKMEPGYNKNESGFILDKEKHDDENIMTLEYATIYFKHASRFEIYEEYVKRLSKADFELEKIYHYSAEFRTGLNTFLSKHNIEFLGTKHFIYRPSQKLARYPLLLKAIEKNTEMVTYAKYYSDLIEEMRYIAKKVDNIFSIYSTQFKIYRLDQKLKYRETVKNQICLGLFQKKRKLLRQGELLVRTDVYFEPYILTVYIFDHVILFCDIQQGEFTDHYILDDPVFLSKVILFKENLGFYSESDKLLSFYPIYVLDTTTNKLRCIYFEDEDVRNIYFRIIKKAMKKIRKNFDTNIRMEKLDIKLDNDINNACKTYKQEEYHLEVEEEDDEEVIVEADDSEESERNEDKKEKEEQEGDRYEKGDREDVTIDKQEDAEEELKNDREEVRDDTADDVQEEDREEVLDDTKNDVQEDDTKNDVQEEDTKNDVQEDDTMNDVQEDDTKNDVQEDDTMNDVQEDDTKNDVQEDDTKNDVQEDDTMKDVQEDDTKNDDKDNLKQENVIQHENDNLKINNREENHLDVYKDNNQEKSLNNSAQSEDNEHNNSFDEEDSNENTFEQRENISNGEDLLIKAENNAKEECINSLHELNVNIEEPSHTTSGEEDLDENVGTLYNNQELKRVISEYSREQISENRNPTRWKSNLNTLGFGRESFKDKEISDEEPILIPQENENWVRRFCYSNDFFNRTFKYEIDEEESLTEEFIRKQEEMILTSSTEGIMKIIDQEKTLIYNNPVTKVLYDSTYQVVIFQSGSTLYVAKFNCEMNSIEKIDLKNDIGDFFYGSTKRGSYIASRNYGGGKSSLIYLFLLEKKENVVSVELSRKLYVGFKVYNIFFSKDKIVIACKDFEVVDMDTLRTEELLENYDPFINIFFRSIPFSKARCVFPITLNMYILCFDSIGFIVDILGRIITTDRIFLWNCLPTDFKVFKSFLICVGKRCVDVYDLKTGNLVYTYLSNGLEFVKGTETPLLHDNSDFYYMHFD